MSIESSPLFLLWLAENFFTIPSCSTENSAQDPDHRFLKGAQHADWPARRFWGVLHNTSKTKSGMKYAKSHFKRFGIIRRVRWWQNKGSVLTNQGEARPKIEHIKIQTMNQVPYDQNHLTEIDRNGQKWPNWVKWEIYQSNKCDISHIKRFLLTWQVSWSQKNSWQWPIRAKNV